MGASRAGAEEAVSRIRSGQHVFVGSGAAEPELLVAALARRAAELRDVEILHLLTAGSAPWADPSVSASFRHNAFFIGPNVRRAVAEGLADYTPCFLHEIPKLLKSRRLPLDAALVTVSPPDARGRVSLGVSVDVVLAAVESARLVIAQVNPRMPRTAGAGNLVPDGRWLLVSGQTELPELPAAAPGEEAAAIGRHCARLIDDGATLQMGIGAVPDAVLAALAGKKDLGVHTEMFSDGLLPLIESGAVNGRRKTLHPGRIITSFCLGSRRLYDFVDRNPLVEFRPSDYVNDPFVVAKNARMASVNSALQVDLTGQVCADSIGPRFYSGFGGQVDFIRGAARSPGGKSIVALPSTAKAGTVSRIVPTLAPGAGVVTTRADVDFVVTEWGIASLKGRSVRERALALIGAAHPRFRPGLLEDARRLGFVYPDQRPWPSGGLPYPEELETRLPLADGRVLEVRPLKPSDERALRDLFYSHGPATRAARYGSAEPALSRARAQELVSLDYDARLALGAFERKGRASRLLGVARYERGEGDAAELFVTVREGERRRGIGAFLARTLLRRARARGLRALAASLPPGPAARALARALGARLEGSSPRPRAVLDA